MYVIIDVNITTKQRIAQFKICKVFKPTKSAQPNKLTVSIMPTFPSLPAIDLTYYTYRSCQLCLYMCMAYITNKKQPLNYNFVVGLKPH